MHASQGFSGNGVAEKAAGELLGTNHLNNVLATNGAGTVTAAMVAAGIIRRTVVGAPFTDTFPSAEAIRLALNSPPAGSAFLLFYQNSVAQAMTFAAGAGVITLGTVDVSASRTRVYNVTLVNATPASTALATTTNGSKVISNLTAAQVAAVSIGMAISGTGIGAASRVESIDYVNNTVTSTVASTATADNIAVTFSPVVQFHGLGEMTL